MPLASRATITARKPVTRAPTTGTKAPRKMSEASGSASGMPMIARPLPMATASTRATSEVARA
jgi:hypothetical protein